MASFDALLERSGGGADSATFRLTNVGGSDDAYTISLADGTGSIAPSELKLASGETGEIRVTEASGDAVLIVISGGNGVELARVSVVDG